MILFLTTTALGSLSFISNGQWQMFFILSCAIRFFQGYADSLVFTTVIALINTLFVEDKEIYIGYVEAANCIGFMIGPLLGSIIYGYCGYTYTFYAFSGIIFLTYLLQIITISKKLNKEQNIPNFRETLIQSHEFKNSKNKEMRRLTINYNHLKLEDCNSWFILSHKPVFLALLAYGLQYYASQFFVVFISLHFEA